MGLAAQSLAVMVEFLQLLARAVRQFRTYPATSRMCVDAITGCHSAFVALKLEQPLLLRVTSRQLLVSDTEVAPDVVVERELHGPLHLAHIASVEFDRSVTLRDWVQFCSALAEASRPSRETSSVAERLFDAGVASIVLSMTPRPEVFDLSVSSLAAQRIANAERARQAAVPSDAPAQFLYPPEKGWIRLDLGSSDTSISLVDLTLLVNDPAEIAAMLARLVDDSPTNDPHERPALCQRYDDVVMLIGALEPRLGRMLLSKLARAVLDLDPERRRALLKQSILPRLLDGRIDGQAVLAEFPDVELADALCLLLDLEAASPQVLPLALDRLRLAPERRDRMAPLLETTSSGHGSRTADRWATAGFDRHAEQLTRINGDGPKNFGEFSAFDLAVDEQATAALAEARDAITSTDATATWLGCVFNLAHIEPNPTIVEAIVSRAVPVLHQFVRDQRWPEVTRWTARIADIIGAVEGARPDVAAAIRGSMKRLCDGHLLRQLAQVSSSDTDRTLATMIVAALGPSVAETWLDALEAPGERPHVIGLRRVMCESARHVGPAIAERLPGLAPETATVAVAVLGHAGPGYEAGIAGRVSDGDARVSRESLRALARIASPKAAALIAWQIEHGAASIQPVAEEALWHLPAALALAKARDLLGRREFVTRHPHTAARLLERAAQDAHAGLESVLEALAPLRYWFWSPALARVGARAHGLL